MNRWPILLDEDSSAHQLEGILAADGWDVLSIRGLGWTGLPDPEVLARATQMHRVVVTANRDDYIALSKDWNTAGKFHAGIVVRFPQGAPPFRSAAAVKRVLGDHPGPLDGLVLWANAR